MYSYHLTPKSGNAKTGPIPVSTSSRDTCPDSCPLKRNGCYADGGPLAMHWSKVTDGRRGTSYLSFLDKIAALPEGQLWRHNQAGDLPGVGNDIDYGMLAQLAIANRGRQGFTYTHKTGSERNLRACRDANVAGFTVNLSANSVEHADTLYGKGSPVATIATRTDKTYRTPKGRKVVTCPATIRDGITCADCKLCARSDRDFIIAFPVHGASKRKAATVAGSSIS